jgi:hypothetical protein
MSGFLAFPLYKEFGLSQKARFLQATLLATGLASLIFCWLNLRQGATGLAAYLALFAVICFLAIYLNQKGSFRIASALLFIFSLIAIEFNLFDGAALHDPGVAAFPVFILFAGFLLDRRGILFSWLASIFSVLFLFFGHQYGLFVLNAAPTINRVTILSTLYSVTAIGIWVILASFRQAEHTVEDAYHQTIQGLVRALELRDIETMGHSERVTNLAFELGKRMGFTDEELENLRLGALLHDIGKLGIKDSILLKPGKLTEEEFEVVKKHTTYAYNVLSNIPRFHEAVFIPRYHHEQWDGKGYPEGLEGRHIPLAARLFSVVDQWDALRSSRPYREAWSDEKAKDYLREGAGTRYDPLIVTAFLEMIEQKNKVSPL